MTRVARLLETTGWTETALAAHLGVSQPTVHRLKHGQREGGPMQRLLDQLESDLAAGRIAPAGAADSVSSLPAQPAGGSAAAASAGLSVPPAEPDAQFSGFASAHGGE